MSELRELADRFDVILKNKNLEKYTYTLSKSEKQEMNVEDGGFKLMRTVFNNNASLRVWLGTKAGGVGGNDWKSLRMTASQQRSLQMRTLVMILDLTRARTCLSRARWSLTWICSWSG